MKLITLRSRPGTVNSHALWQKKEPGDLPLRDVLAFPADISFIDKADDFREELMRFNRAGNNDFVIRGLDCEPLSETDFALQLTGNKANDANRLEQLAISFVDRFGDNIVNHQIKEQRLLITASHEALDYLTRLRSALPAIPA